MLPDDAKIISADDHVIEHAMVWQDRLPAKYKDAGPQVIHEDGIPIWYYEGRRYQPLGLDAVAGDDPAGWGVCEGIFTCGTPLANEEGSDPLKIHNVERARAALQAAGYNGEKVVLIAPGDYPQINALSLVTADLIRRLGMNLELIAADWGTLVQRRTSREPVERGGWSIIHTTSSGQSLQLPVFHLFLRANGANAWFGWPDVPEVERLRAEWVEKGGDPAESRRIALALNRAAMEAMYYVPLGYYWQPSVWRRNLTGVFRCPVTAFWNIGKT